MSTWDVVNLITVIGVILAPITTFVFLANSLFNISSAMRKYGTDNQLLANQLAQKDTLLTYLLTNALKNGVGGNVNQQEGARKQGEYVEYASSNSDFYVPTSSSGSQLVVANKRAELRTPIFRSSGFWIGVLSGLCVFLATSLFFILFFLR